MLGALLVGDGGLKEDFRLRILCKLGVNPSLQLATAWTRAVARQAQAFKLTEGAKSSRAHLTQNSHHMLMDVNNSEEAGHFSRKFTVSGEDGFGGHTYGRRDLGWGLCLVRLKRGASLDMVYRCGTQL